MKASLNPYTSAIPSGSLNRVVLTVPSHVVIQWPNVTGHTVPTTRPLSGFIRSIFG